MLKKKKKKWRHCSLESVSWTKCFRRFNSVGIYLIIIVIYSLLSSSVFLASNYTVYRCDQSSNCIPSCYGFQHRTLCGVIRRMRVLFWQSIIIYILRGTYALDVCSTSTNQRHFLFVTGLSPKRLVVLVTTSYRVTISLLDRRVQITLRNLNVYGFFSIIDYIHFVNNNAVTNS